MKEKYTYPRFSLDDYLNNAIRNIMSNAYKAVFSNPKESLFIYRMQKVFGKLEKRRKAYKEKENLHIPPFLISSIAINCNLTCKGCYACANSNCETVEKGKKAELTAEQWKQIFLDANKMGVNFNILIGGEPLLRKDILKAAAEVKEMIFPIFTNGTMITEPYLDFFSEHLNLVPILSIEGCKENIDDRRGLGVFNKVIHSIELLKDRELFYGASITISTENLDMVTSLSYVKLLKELGCKIIFYVEYAQAEASASYLGLDEKGIAQMEVNLERLRVAYEDILFLSFPGYEKAMGGCLAAGRGFLHISSEGEAEVCPFSPYSDRNVAETGLKEALKSPFFAKLRKSGLIGGEHSGGCTLFEHEEQVKQMLNDA